MVRRPSDKDIIRSLAAELPVGIWVARAPGGEFVYANSTFAEIMGTGARSDVEVGEYAVPYGICTRTGEPYPEDRMPFVQAVEQRTTVVADDIVIHRPDGRRVHVRAQARPVFGEDGDDEITHVVIAFIDITREVEAEQARAETEARLQRAQRMESIGKLAGGIAHDFNNLLATIKLVATSLRRRLADPDHLHDLEMIDEVTERAVQLTRALLGFAGRGKNLAQRTSLNDALRELRPLVERTIGRRIRVNVDLRAANGDVVGDRAQLEQVFMNLVVNSRDAIGAAAGEITLRSYDRVLDLEAARRHPPLRPGPHVVVEVIDTGGGIDPKIRDRIFEPYFTTKNSGPNKGHGLGLATVWGIVDSHGGAIEVLDHEPRGTMMRLLFPSATRTARRPTPGVGQTPQFRPGRGSILLVDDEDLVRSSMARALHTIGYRVIAAADGADAVDYFRAHHDELVAVILDMVMPDMDGRATYLALRAIQPEVPVLLTTGFSLNEEAQSILDLGVRGFIAKPCSIEALSEALAQVIQTGPEDLPG